MMKERLLGKLLSARWLITVMLVGSFCWGFIIKLVPVELFVPVVLLVCDWYFKRIREEKK